MPEYFWIVIPGAFMLCAWMSFRKGSIFGAESALQSLESDGIITIDNEGLIEPVCPQPKE